MLRKLFASTTFCLATALVVVATSSAADFCVGAHPSCPLGATVFNTSQKYDDLESAFGAAVDDTDSSSRVFIGAGVYDAGYRGPKHSFGPFDFDHRVEVIGAGATQTVLMRQSESSENALLDLTFVDRSSTLSGLTTSVKIDATSGRPPAPSLRVTGGSVDNVTVELDAFYYAGRPAAVLDDASMFDSRVAGRSDVGIEVHGSGEAVELSNVSVTGDQQADTVGVRQVNMGAKLNAGRLRVFGYGTAFSAENSSASISNSSFLLTGGTGLSVSSDGTSDNTVELESSTIAGGINDKTAVDVLAASDDPGATHPLNVSLKDSLIDARGLNSKAFNCVVDGPVATPGLSLLRTVYDFDTVSNDGCSYSASTDDFDSHLKPPVFAGEGWTVSPAWNSPWIDASGISTTDQAEDAGGNTRVVAGKAPFTNAILDPGAYEYQASIPAATQIGMDGPPEFGRPVRFDALSSDSDPHEVDQMAYQWDFGDGTNATGNPVSHNFSAYGVFSVSVVAVDPAGRASAPLTRTVALTAPLPDVPPRDTTPPRIKVTKKPKSGRSRKAVVVFRVNEPASTVCRLDNAKIWQRCRSPWSRTVRAGKHVLRIQAVDRAANRSAVVNVRWTVRKRR